MDLVEGEGVVSVEADCGVGEVAVAIRGGADMEIKVQLSAG